MVGTSNQSDPEDLPSNIGDGKSLALNLPSGKLT